MLEPIRNYLKEDGEIVALIKPQFEAGREKVGKKGVVREKSTHHEVIEKVALYAQLSLIHIFYQWLQDLAVYLILVSAILQALPQESYQKYIRFFSGLVLIILLMTPLLRLTDMEAVSYTHLSLRYGESDISWEICHE